MEKLIATKNEDGTFKVKIFGDIAKEIKPQGKGAYETSGTYITEIYRAKIDITILDSDISGNLFTLTIPQ